MASDQRFHEARPTYAMGRAPDLEAGDVVRSTDRPVAAPSRPRVDVVRVAAAVRELLAAIGEDVDREGLRETPQRVARWWREFIDYDPGTLSTSFASIGTDQLVIVKGIKVWSVCEHHLIPFWCRVDIGYIPNGSILGLSKFARIAHARAHAPQVQERLVEQIAADVRQLTDSVDVIVVAEGEHLCMSARGIRADGATMVSSSIHGVFQQSAPRAEFMSLVSRTVRP